MSLVALLLLLAASGAASGPSAAPAARGGVCDAIADCGAVADNLTLADAALSACAQRCATVVFPAGAAFRVASVDISNTSGLSLVFRDGASLWASAAKADYPLAPFFPPMGRTLCYRAVIFGRNVSRLSVEGPASAVIDGAGAAWQPGRNESAIQAPKLFELVDASDVNVTGLTMQNSANWHIHVLWCARVRFVNNTVLGNRSFGGTDGIDPSSCTDVLIDGAYIDVGDDAIAVTAGGAHDVTNALMPTSRIVVRNSYLRARNFAIGSATYSNVSEVLVEDCRIGDDEGSAAWGIKIKSHSPNGGDVSNVTFRNLRLGRIAPNSYEEPNGGMALSLYSNYGDAGAAEGPPSGAPPFAPSRTHNITFVNITGLSARWAASPLAGVPGGSELGPLHFENVDFGDVSEAQAWLCSNVSGTTVSGTVRPPLPASCGVAGRGTASLGVGAGTGPGPFFVSPSGDDAHNGLSPASAFRTPQRAQQAARAVARPLAADLFVYLGAGVYELNETLALTPGDGGDGPAARVVWALAPADAAAGASAVLSGGRALAWAPAPPGQRAAGVLRADLPPELRGSRPRQLFVRNERRFPARVPAPAGPRRADLYSDASTLHLVDSLDGCGYSAPGGCWPAAGCAAVDAWGFVFNSSAGAGPPLAYEDLPGVDVLSFGSWTAAWAPVARVVAENATLITAAPLANAPPGAMGGACTSGGRYVLHNVAESLAAGSGASYFSDAENAVYYAPLPSEAAAGLALEAVVPVLPTVLSVVGDDCGGPLSFIAFEGLNISHSTEGEPRPGSYQAAHGAVRLSSAAHVRLHNVSVAHAGGQGVLLDGALVEVALDAVDVRDTGGDGVGDSGATGDNVGTSITNCIVESTGHIFLAQPGGIRVTGSAAGTVTVAHNLVRDTSYSGIALGWTQGAARPPPGPVSSYQFVVDSNVVTDIGQATLNDFGAIYLSTNGFVCEATETCFLPSLVTGNLVTQVNGYAEAGSGVYTDENMAGLYAVGNVFAFLSHNAVYLHCGDNHTVVNNILYDGHDRGAGQASLFGSCNTGGVSPPDANVSMAVQRNVLVVAGAGSTLFDAGELFPAANVSFEANTYFAVPPLSPAAALAFPPANSRSFAQWQAAGQDVNGGVGDPLIANPQPAPGDGDWRLGAASPALARGFQQLDLSKVGPQR